MNAEKTPVELLRAAAALLRERAAKATPGPWNYCRLDSPHSETPEKAEIFAGPRDEWGHLTGCVAFWVEEDGGRLSHEDGAWLEAVDPRLGEPLAAWLEQTADRLKGARFWGETWRTGWLDAYPYGPALAVARTVLGEVAPAAVTS